MRFLSRDLTRWVMRAVAARFDRVLRRRESGMVVVVLDGNSSKDALIGREVSWAGARFDLASGGGYCVALQVRELWMMGVVWGRMYRATGLWGAKCHGFRLAWLSPVADWMSPCDHVRRG
ncbi:hypothetical protein E2553_33910 [Paraburkholderia dipogonis]|uniref:Uncharacterized protein n=1 Tax=Paraburkholderia dipogonis TaxID=1211383 RepID=A0A4Y8MVU1_9BURK|nr:hypothetical protein [Paraburkholderia dipogonis]TFE41656.1 hypothetical protein E2553_33910 [Paraburkholderia dipogonis]